MYSCNLLATYFCIFSPISTFSSNINVALNSDFSGLIDTASLTLTLNISQANSITDSADPRSKGDTTLSSKSTTPNDILIGEYKSNEIKIQCQAGNWLYNISCNI